MQTEELPIHFPAKRLALSKIEGTHPSLLIIILPALLLIAVRIGVSVPWHDGAGIDIRLDGLAVQGEQRVMITALLCFLFVCRSRTGILQRHSDSRKRKAILPIHVHLAETEFAVICRHRTVSVHGGVLEYIQIPGEFVGINCGVGA